MWWAALGVLGFSGSLPATRVAAPELGGLMVGLSRAVVAGMLALLVLAWRRERLPGREHWRGLAVVGLGVVLGFPLLTSVALQTVPSVHAAVVVGLSPACTAVFATLRGGERPGGRFWLAVLLGVVAVGSFALAEGVDQFGSGDLLLLLGVGLVGLGYAEGGRLARQLGGFQVIAWALVACLPVACAGAAFLWWLKAPQASPQAWAGVAYLSVISMFLAFIAWYRGLALGGVAVTSQVQLLQPVLSALWGALLLGEHLPTRAVLAGGLIVASAALVRLSRAPRPA